MDSFPPFSSSSSFLPQLARTLTLVYQLIVYGYVLKLLSHFIINLLNINYIYFVSSIILLQFMILPLLLVKFFFF